MKFIVATTLIIYLASVQSRQAGNQMKTSPSMDNYLNELSTEIVDNLLSKAKEEPVGELVQQPTRELLDVPSNSGVQEVKSAGQNPERKLSYDSLTNSFLMGNSDDTSTTNHLSMLISEQKAMQNYRMVGSWLNDLENNLDDLRDAVNRRVTDLATGLQRRNQLLGHYNYIGQGMGVGGQGFPGPAMGNPIV